jgi:hypothetical protein
VKHGRGTTIDADIDVGVINVIVGFASLKPAELVIITLRLRVAQVGSWTGTGFAGDLATTGA